MYHLILTAGLHTQPACRRLAHRMHMYIHDVMYCQRQTKKWWQTGSKNHATTVSAQLLKHQCMMLITVVQSVSLRTFLEWCEITLMQKNFTYPWVYRWLIYNIQTRLTPYSLQWVIQLEIYTLRYMQSATVIWSTGTTRSLAISMGRASLILAVWHLTSSMGWQTSFESRYFKTFKFSVPLAAKCSTVQPIETGTGRIPSQ